MVCSNDDAQGGAASSNSNGPCPARTTRPAGWIAACFKATCKAPTVVTPGSVQPGIGIGRSIAPLAISTARARTRCAIASGRWLRAL